MAAGIEQIEQDLQMLAKAGAEIAAKALSLYRDYLQALGRSVRQQLIQASYHVCIQIYPENFLQLSLSQRQQLQQDLQQLGKQVQSTLESARQHLESAESEPLATLEELVEAQEHLEKEIVDALHHTSRQVNQLLQTVNILPATPLDMILEVAAKAEAAGRPVTRSPNLLTAMVDSEDGDEEEMPETAVIAVYLQIGEIEFTDPLVMMHRNQVRDLGQQISRLQQQTKQKQREKLIAEAGAAWRSTWQDEP